MQELLLAVARGLVEDKEAVQVTVDPMRASVDADKTALEKIFGTTVVGHAYAQGSSSSCCF